MLSSREIRQQFIDYFVERCGHTFVPSSPVVPHDDPTLLFANAGMNQFKDVFLGVSGGGARPYTRATNTQKCIRAGGKHNDLEDVGKDTYHHTFFEMLGNWSFGDYFKKEAIAWAWDLLTNVWGLEKDRLHATVFGGDEQEGLARDEEAANLWRTLTDIRPEHIHFCGKKDNFWEMGDTGPCGPCSEIHVDLTPDKSGRELVNAGDPRVIEIWNLVFIQFNRGPGSGGAPGKLSPLPAKHVDTGMGFERVCAVLQGKTSNYDTDVFSPLFRAISEVTGARPYGGELRDPIDTAYRVIADHIRCLTFALTDGAVPSNEGRGYVLRRILRRAVRHGRQTLGVQRPFLHELVPAVVEAMGEAFPELTRHPARVAALIKEEEESFGQTLDRGIELFEAAAQRGGRTISGQDAFRLYDTYGFPLDLTELMAEERGMSVDVDEFNRLMDEARARSRGGGEGGGLSLGDQLIAIVQKHSPAAGEFVGNEVLEAEATVTGIYELAGEEPQPAEQTTPGRRYAVVCNRTPFYGESGGQVGDTGTIGERFQVEDTLKVGEVHFHLGRPVEGAAPLAVGQTVHLRVDEARRRRIMANHTATHMLNRALRKYVNPEADQKGSLVDPEKLRFDFSQNAAVTPEQIEQVEQQVNADIAADLPVYYGYTPVEQGRQIHGLRAVFGEKYPPTVRVVSIGVPVEELCADPANEQWGDYSIEFCGGTHLARTGDAEGLVIVSEEAVGKGVRRLVALTGQAAHQAAAQGDMLLARVQALKQAPPEQLAGAIAECSHALGERQIPLLTRARIREEMGELQKIAKQQEKDRSKQAAGDVVETARRIAEEADSELIVAAVEGADGKTLRTAMDVIRKKRPEAALLLGAASDGKVAFVAAVPPGLIDKGLKAGDWVREAAQVAGGSGGGRPDMAQAGGKDPDKLDQALQAARAYAQAKVAG